MNRDKILGAYRRLKAAENEILEAMEDFEEAIKADMKEKMWFDNGKVIINGVEYPIENFTIEWKHRDES